MVRALLIVAAQKKSMWHLDIESSYLNEELIEEIFMEQPPDFEKPGHESKVLHKIWPETVGAHMEQKGTC